jgi:hypothetical protein
MTTLATIHAIHASLYPRAVRKPRNMDYAPLPDSAKDDLSRAAMSIFADCTNVGVPFQDAILAVYLSGLQHGSAATEEQAEYDAEIKAMAGHD